METSLVTHSLCVTHGKSGAVLAAGKGTEAFIWLIVLIRPGNSYFQAGACVARCWAFISENAAKLPSTFSSFWNFPLSLTKFKLLCKSRRFKLLCGIYLSKELLPHNYSHCILHSLNCCCEVCGQPALCAACF